MVPNFYEFQMILWRSATCSWICLKLHKKLYEFTGIWENADDDDDVYYDEDDDDDDDVDDDHDDDEEDDLDDYDDDDDDNNDLSSFPNNEL